MTKLNMLSGVGFAVLALISPIAAHAADNNTIGDVVVTATKTGSTNLQKTAIAVSVVGGDVLDKSRIVTLRDLPSAVSDLKIVNAGVNIVPYIRGVGGYASNNEQDVGIYMDGVYLGRSSVALQSNFNDLERVEVVKGPQGTVFGRNAVGGAINFISREPSKEFQFQDTLNFGNYNLIDEAVRLSGPVTDKLQASAAIGYQKHDGYIQDVVAGIPPAGAVNRFSFRGGLKYEVNPDITNLVRVDYMYTNEHFAPVTTLVIATNDPRNVSATGVYNGYNAPLADAAVGNLHYYGNGFPDSDSEVIYGVSDELNWKINDNISVKNLVAYRTSKTIYVQGGNGTEYLTGATRGNYIQHQFSEEIDVPHTFGNLKGVGGVFLWTEYEHQSADSISIFAPPVNTSPTGSDSYQDTRFPTQSYAVFLNESYHITPDIAVTLGGRYNQEHKVLDTYNTQFNWTGGLPLGWVGSNPANPGVRGTVKTATVVCNTPAPGQPAGVPPLCTGPGINYYFTPYIPFVAGYGNNFALNYPSVVPQLSENYTAFTPKFGLEWQATKDAFLYFNATRGFKSGGFNFTARSPLGLTYQPEYITSYEVGAKTDWFDKRLRLNVAVFRNDWSNLQVNQSVSVPGSTTPFQQSSNAASARITGLDTDITAKPWDGWTFTSSVTWLPDAVYVNYTTGQVSGSFIKNLLIQRGDPRENVAAGTYNGNGKRLQNAPDLSAIITGQRDFDLGNGNSLFVRGEANYTGNTYFDVSNDPIARRNPFALFNGSIGYVSAGGHYQVELWARNIADKQYFYTLSPGTTFEGVPGAPRTFGVQLNYTY